MHVPILPSLGLTSIIPVAFKLDLEKYLELIPKATECGINIILVHDRHNNEIVKEIQELKTLEKEFNFLIIEGHFNSPGYARNAGLKYVNTEWVTFWDSDDTPNIDNVVKLLIETMQVKAAFGIGNFRTVLKTNDHSQNIQRCIPHHNNLKLVALNPGIWRIVYKVDRIRNIYFNNLLLGEDQIFLGDLKLQESEVFFGDISVYDYFMGEQSQLSKSKANFGELERARIAILERLKQCESAEMERILIIIYFRLFISSLTRTKHFSLGALRKPLVELRKPLKCTVVFMRIYVPYILNWRERF